MDRDAAKEIGDCNVSPVSTSRINVLGLAKSSWWRIKLDLRCKDLEDKDDSLNEQISDKGVCITAPATPGLFKNFKNPANHFPCHDS